MNSDDIFSLSGLRRAPRCGERAPQSWALALIVFLIGAGLSGTASARGRLTRIERSGPIEIGLLTRGQQTLLSVRNHDRRKDYQVQLEIEVRCGRRGGVETRRMNTVIEAGDERRLRPRRPFCQGRRVRSASLLSLDRRPARRSRRRQRRRRRRRRPRRSPLVLDGGMLFGIPQGQFGEEVQGFGFGFNGRFGFAVGNSPLSIGCDLSYFTYGAQTRDIPFSYYSDRVTLREETRSSLFGTHLFLRFEKTRGAVRPYGDLLFGFKSLSTDTEIYDPSGGREEGQLAASNQMSDYALSYGLGAGLALRLSGPLHFFLDLRYLFGNEAEYLNASRAGSIETREPRGGGPARTTINPSRTETDVMTIVFGLSLR